MKSKPKIVIVGGVAAGPKAAARARRLAPEADITIVERGQLISYAGCGMPFYLSGKMKKFEDHFTTGYGAVRDEEFFLKEKGIRVLTGTEVTAVDRANKNVKARNLNSGEDLTLPYDKLVLATGSTPSTPPIKNIDLKGVYYLNQPEDAREIKNILDSGKVEEAVVIGAGPVGMEVVDALMSHHIFATVVEAKNQIMPGLLDPDTAAVLQTKLEDQGVEFYTNTVVSKITGDENGRVTGVIAEKEEIDADLVIIATGVRPNVKLARACGLVIGETGAVAVNEYLQTSDPDIYALGDCIENNHIVTGQKVYMPSATYANRQGRVTGDNVTGRQTKFKGVLGTTILEVRGINIGRTGLGEKEARNSGFDVVAVLGGAHATTHFHPNHGLILIKIVADARTRRILGAQALGVGDVAKRIDVLATAITFGATVDDLSDVDLGYAPQFSTPIDPAVYIANTVSNKLNGLAKTVTPAEMHEKIKRGDDFIILDVRNEQQYRARHIEDKRVMRITIKDLRKRLNDIPKNKEIITLCALGLRSYEALRILEGAGFKDVKFMEGGMEGWPYEID